MQGHNHLVGWKPRSVFCIDCVNAMVLDLKQNNSASWMLGIQPVSAVVASACCKYQKNMIHLKKFLQAKK